MLRCVAWGSCVMLSACSAVHSMELEPIILEPAVHVDSEVLPVVYDEPTVVWTEGRGWDAVMYSAEAIRGGEERAKIEYWLETTPASVLPKVNLTVREGQARFPPDQDPTAEAVCMGNSRGVRYSADRLTRFTIEAFRFLRYHEMAHHVLGHVIRCFGSEEKAEQTVQREVEADCWATWALIGDSTTAGVEAVAAVRALFHAQADAGSTSHPPSRERAQWLGGRCQNEGLWPPPRHQGPATFSYMIVGPPKSHPSHARLLH